ncbi:MAG: class I SAM-dependent methyltransferase [Sedimentisphaerales bacterium]|nr:class I SAM-dependent methyltransferase [Sedimentisphaerales bacterium]
MKSKDKVKFDWKNDKHTHLDVRRLYSYICQLEYAMDAAPEKVLYVGKGTGIAPDLLSRCPGDPEVATIDIEPDFKPDIVGSILDIPLEDNSFDVTMCCQVLEHLPFDSFQNALEEIWRVTKNRLVLSVPNRGLYFGFRAKVPLLKFGFSISLPRFPLMFLSYPEEKAKLNGHCWEIGYKGTSMATVKKRILDAGWMIKTIKRVPDWAWHTFFVLQKN